MPSSSQRYIATSEEREEGCDPLVADTHGGASPDCLESPIGLHLPPRLAIHALLLVLLLLAGGRIIPFQIDAGNLGGLTIATSSEPESALISSSYTSGSRHYLQSAVVPYTIRVLGDVLPLTSTQKQVRTWVITYTVQQGDTVSGIAQKFGLESTSILWANDSVAKSPDYLQVGDELTILPIDGAYHTVVSGDTLEAIAQTYTVDPSMIVDFPGNNLAADDTLTPGQQIIIPGGQKPYQAQWVSAYSGTIPSDASRGSGSFVWPISGYLTQTYWAGHRAIDIGASIGTPVYASDSGFVSKTQVSDSGYGRMIMIDHRNGYSTLYAHLSSIWVDVGESVSRGQQIGLSGSTGNSTGPHLHFEIIENGVRRNPLIYLP